MSDQKKVNPTTPEASGEDTTESLVKSVRPRMRKKDAVRRTLAEGIEDNREGVRYVYDTFGLKMTLANFSAFKSQVKRRAQVRGNPKHGNGAATGDVTASKTHAVRVALAEGVSDNNEGSTYIKTRFGIEVSPVLFASIKSQLARRQREMSDEIFDDLATVKELVRRLGAGQVRRLVSLFE